MGDKLAKAAVQILAAVLVVAFCAGVLVGRYFK